MSGVLILGEIEQRKIEAAIMAARAKPTPFVESVVDDTGTPELMLADRKIGVTELRREYPSQHIILGTYRASFSFEYQPSGLFRHLSVSSLRADRLPGPQVMLMVCEAFGFSQAVCKGLQNNDGEAIAAVARVWLEEFRPGHKAVNIVELVNEIQ